MAPAGITSMSVPNPGDVSFYLVDGGLLSVQAP